MGSLTIDLEHASTARSHSRSGSRSPALAKPMMALRLPRAVDRPRPSYAGPDGEFECDTQETRGLWIESLPIKILSDRHCRKQRPRPWPTIWFGREHLSVGYPTQKPICSRIFCAGKYLGNVSPSAEDDAETGLGSVAAWSALEGVFRLPKYTRYVHTLWAFIPNQTRSAS